METKVNALSNRVLDAVADAAAKLMDARGHLLQAGAGGGHNPDRPGAHVVGKPQADTADEGRAAVRAHDDQAPGGGHLLQRDFIFDRNVVAEQKDVFAQSQRLASHSGCITPGDGNQHPGSSGQGLRGHLQALRAIFLFERRAAVGQELVDLREGCASRGRVLRSHDDHQVVGLGRGRFGRQQVGLRE